MKKNFEKRLRELREEKEWSQKDLATKLGLTQPAIADWERGTRKPNLTKIEEIADIFGVTVDYLLGRSNKKGVIITLSELRKSHPKLADDLTRVGAEYIMWDEEISYKQLIKFLERQAKKLDKRN